ncbi:MAG: methylenetetrahydrofolate reductase [NAD(P)H] [Phycisphaeraceae bacterium]|nr:methylenetetrahydrofolate reductase [NAD(P)H] [Phycisphaeraceae bacterium]MCW5755100.1 methylenetetrahydrofolate reductase [NAD(P)H] [Phycisphaeraceae bacterium]
MHLRDILVRSERTFSFEFYPPRSDAAAEELLATMGEFERLRPTFVSVTYGAGGTTRERTHHLVTRLAKETSLDPMPHLTCVCHDETEIARILERYAAAGISNIMALRGDLPESGAASRGSFRYASELVRMIRRFGEQGGHPDRRGFGVGVAGYPEGHPGTPNRLLEMDHLKAKVDAGADVIVTQLFFDNRDFYDFRERCLLAGIKVPVIAGIMPVTTAAGMKRMAELAGGTRFPAGLLRAVNRAGSDDAALARVGVHWATEQCRDLLDHDVAGIHFYTLNRSPATREIYASLGVKDSLALIGQGGY